MRSTAIQLQQQYREQIKAQAERAEMQRLRNLRWALSTSDADPKAVEDMMQAYAKRLRGGKHETD